MFWSNTPSEGMNAHLPTRVLDPLAIGAATLSIVWLGLQMYV